MRMVLTYGPARSGREEGVLKMGFMMAMMEHVVETTEEELY